MVRCCKLSLYANESCEERAVLSAIIEMTCHVHQVFSLCNDVISPDFRVFIHVHSTNSEYDITSKCPNEYSTVDKVGLQNF